MSSGSKERAAERAISREIAGRLKRKAGKGFPLPGWATGFGMDRGSAHHQSPAGERARLPRAAGCKRGQGSPAQQAGTSPRENRAAPSLFSREKQTTKQPCSIKKPVIRSFHLPERAGCLKSFFHYI